MLALCCCDVQAPLCLDQLHCRLVLVVSCAVGMALLHPYRAARSFASSPITPCPPWCRPLCAAVLWADALARTLLHQFANFMAFLVLVLPLPFPCLGCGFLSPSWFWILRLG